MSFNEQSHPRTPAGSPDGGKFATKPGGSEADTSALASHTSVAEILSDYRDDGDPWGSTLGEAFAVCDTLTALGEPVPAEAEYRPAAGLNAQWLTDDDDGGEFDQARELFSEVNAGTITADQLRTYLTDTLLPKRDELEAAGQSY